MKVIKKIISILFIILLVVGLFFIVKSFNLFGYIDFGNNFNAFKGNPNNSSFEKANTFISETALKDGAKLEKWTSKIKIRIDGLPNETDKSTLNNIVENFNSIKGFPGMEIVDKEENVLISYATNDSYKELSENYDHKNSKSGSFCIHYQKNGIINKANIVIAPRSPQGFKNSEVLHEMLHLVGFYNHPSDNTSILNTKGPVSGLSDTDILSFMMIYNQDIPVGTTIINIEEYYKKTTIENFLNMQQN